jgi:hypothetical protein
VSIFVIRNQGFFYTDEYFAPVGEYKQIVKRTFTSHEAAEEARKAYVRSWIRQHPLGDFLFDDGAAIAKVVALFRASWPEAHGDLESDELYDLLIPKHASDDEVDAILEAAGLELAKVFEVRPGELVEAATHDADTDHLGEDDGADSDEELGEDFDEDFDEDFGDPEDELYWGPEEGAKPFRVIHE